MRAPMSRRSVLRCAVAQAAASLLPWRAALGAAWARYDATIAIDGCGAPGNSQSDTRSPLTATQVEDVRQSGLTCLNVTVGAVGIPSTDGAFARMVQDIGYWEAQVDLHPEAFARVRDASDIDTAKQTRRTGLVYALQDGVAFESDLSRLDALHRLGIRVIQPTYNRRNLLGDGCLEPANAGLSRAGLEAIERMNSLGIVVDLSHCGRQTTADAIRISKRPVVFTHTGCAALAEHPRNRTDRELRAVADTGGVAGIYFMPYLNAGHQASAQQVIHHLEHAIDVAGDEHVSVGTDGGVSAEVVDEAYRRAFAEGNRARRRAGIAAPGETEDGYLFAADLNHARRFEMLATLLADRGHSDARIEKVLGGNLRRVFAAAWSG